MKVFAYACRGYDEAPLFEKHAGALGIEIGMTSEILKEETLRLAEGCRYISTVTTRLDASLLDGLKEMGVRLVSTRTIGYETIDLEYARKIGIHISNVSYAPESVAEYTLMLMLAALRRVSAIMKRMERENFSLKGVCGELLTDKTIGVIGTGSIGSAVVKMLIALGCRVYVNNRHGGDVCGGEYLPLDELLSRCDLVTLHTPMNDGNFHMLDAAAIEKMPRGTIVVNTARGALIDTDALIDGLNSGRIACCALDVAEDSFSRKSGDRMETLRNMENVLITPHRAFYTENAVSEMIYNSLLSCRLTEDGKKNPWEIV